jgi:hypothetical protein
MVDSRENAILACGIPCKAIIQRFDDADESLPELITMTKRRMAESLSDMMDIMNYPNRRRIIRDLMTEKTSNHRGESDIDLIDLYSSHHTCKTYCKYDADIVNIGQYGNLEGHNGVIKAPKLKGL